MFDRIKKLCEENGTNITALCKEITGSSGNLPTWKKGNIRSDYLKKIAERFNVSTDYLHFGEEKPTSPDGEQPELTEQQILANQLIEKIKVMDSADLMALDALIDRLAQK